MPREEALEGVGRVSERTFLCFEGGEAWGGLKMRDGGSERRREGGEKTIIRCRY